MPDFKIISLQLCINILFQSCPKGCSRWKAWGGSKGGSEPNWFLSMSPGPSSPPPTAAISLKWKSCPGESSIPADLHTPSTLARPQRLLPGQFSCHVSVHSDPHSWNNFFCKSAGLKQTRAHSGHWTTQLAEGKFGKASGLLTKMERQKKSSF